MSTPNAFKWAIGLAKAEPSFGTAMNVVDLTDFFKVKEADFAQLDTDWETDEDEINGYLGATEHLVQERKGGIARKAKASLELCAWSIIGMLGNLTVTGSTPNYIATAKWRDICTVNPPSHSLVELLDCVGLSATKLLYK